MAAVQLKSRLMELPISSWVRALSRGVVLTKNRITARSVKKVYLASRKPQ
ncbi:MAG: hypothetical protein ABI599_06550 [Flavobacteriales bacterium]